jgi:putative NADH-flavin reductase
MRVLLLGGTGNLGLRCIPALLAHNHVLTLYVRNPDKLRSLISPELLSLVEAVVVGDATDSAGIKKAIIEHDTEAIIDVAGNQVLPWKEFLLPKIARAVSEAAITVGKERGRPMRVWITSGLGILGYPGSPYLVQDL